MVAIYARQSLDVRDSISIEMQIEKGISMCEKDETYRTYVDKGYSGKNTLRPEFLKLIEDIKKGFITKVVVYKLDRFSRSVLDFSNTWEILSKQHVEFVSVNEKFDTSTPIGKAMLFIIIVFAQMERETIAERVTDNYYQRAELGSWMGGPAPYGFEIGRIEKNGSKVPTLIPNENMEHIKEIYTMYAGQEVSLGEVAAWLNEKGISGVKRKTWNNVTLARLLSNPAYVKADADVYAYYKVLGVHVANKLEEFQGIYGGLLVGKRGASTRQRKAISEAKFSIANWEGVIDSNTWLLCQDRLRANLQIKNTGKGRYCWLSGILKCEECGRSVRVTVDKKSKPLKRYLTCTGRIDHMCSRIISLKIDDIEKEVAKELQVLLDGCSNETITEEQPVSNLEKIELRGIEEKIQNLIDFISNGAASELTIEYINEELKKLTARQREISLNMEIIEKKQIVLEKIIFDDASFEEKKSIAKTYIKEVKILKNGIEIIWSI